MGCRASSTDPFFASCQRREPFVAANTADGDAGWELDCLLGIVCGQQVGQAPTGLGVGSLVFGEIGPVGDLAFTESHA